MKYGFTGGANKVRMTPKRLRNIATLYFKVAIFIFAFTSPVLGAQLDLVTRLDECGFIQSGDSRLQCYDRVVADIRSLRKSGEEANDELWESEDVRVTRVLIHPNLNPQPKDDLGAKYLRESNADAPAEGRFSLISMVKDNQGRWQFHFQNGHVWQQLEARFISKPKTFPVDATIKQGVLGSHNLSLDGRSASVKVKRIK